MSQIQEELFELYENESVYFDSYDSGYATFSNENVTVTCLIKSSESFNCCELVSTLYYAFNEFEINKIQNKNESI